MAQDLGSDPLSRIGWREQDALALAAPRAPGLQLARVVAQHRNAYDVHDGRHEFSAKTPAALVRRGLDPLLRPLVGDWVLLEAGTPPMILSVLARRTLIARAAAGERFQKQGIAANIDTALIVCGLDRDYNPRRIERYLALIEGSGVNAVVVLTKLDLAPDAQEKLGEIETLLGASVPVLAVNAKDPETATRLAPWCQPGHTLVLMGSSGAGKSTLTNTLLGEARQRVAAVRASDSRGRHTTTMRSLIALPSGACIIDTPGMRELKLTGTERLETGHFGDLEALAAGCRFRDCRHEREPGCAIRAAIAAGTLAPERYDHYRKLLDERGRAAGAQQNSERSRETKMLTRALGKRLTEKYGSR
jgi:ribosome biogenesis GTPase